ncbi:Protein ANTAGONIST OF LIKE HETEROCHROMATIN PROTEIN 1 [Formica fusca]
MPLLRELRENDPENFKNYLQMDNSTFEYILNLIRPYIQKQDTVMRECITAEERLAATLRFLTTGRSLQDLKFSTSISAPVLCHIIPETYWAIFSALKKKFLKFPESKEDWLHIAKEFEEKWNFINCGGALDGKHIRIVQPRNTGAQYYNYKHFYSIVLMALVNANYELIFIDVGKNGRISDGGVIECTEFYKRLQSNLLKSSHSRGNET